VLVLGIETSCDETAAAVVRDGRQVLSSVVATQARLHVPYGGVVPEIACRAHLSAMLPVLHRALEEAGVTIEEIDAVAVGNRPGLIGSLLIGLTTAKVVAWLYNLPIIGVNHIHAHAYAAALDREGPVFPCATLVVSGGHTTLFNSRSPIDHEIIGATRDDAAGEAFDKAASILGLSYPGGPAIGRAARNGDRKAVHFKRTRFENSLDFSFSGIKTAVLYHCRGQNAAEPKAPLSEKEVADVAASFQEAVTRTLADRLIEAAETIGARRVCVGGGVAANSRLREMLQKAAPKRGLELLMPPMKYCLDNAAMVAGLGWRLHQAGEIADLTLDAYPTVRPSPQEAARTKLG
jgi:N6-L-threonylcarbamoyladenine synthase